MERLRETWQVSNAHLSISTSVYMVKTVLWFGLNQLCQVQILFWNVSYLGLHQGEIVLKVFLDIDIIGIILYKIGDSHVMFWS